MHVLPQPRVLSVLAVMHYHRITEISITFALSHDKMSDESSL